VKFNTTILSHQVSWRCHVLTLELRDVQGTHMQRLRQLVHAISTDRLVLFPLRNLACLVITLIRVLLRCYLTEDADGTWLLQSSILFKYLMFKTNQCGVVVRNNPCCKPWLKDKDIDVVTSWTINGQCDLILRSPLCLMSTAVRC
jgi:hypothetical protein